MNCCKCDGIFQTFNTKKIGVLIDKCNKCDGIWLDEGEINFFIKNKRIKSLLTFKGLENLKESNFDCPKCNDGQKLKTGTLRGANIELENCSNCNGFFLDKGEIAKISKDIHRPEVITKTIATLTGRLMTLPPLQLVSVGVLGSLYAILFAILIFASVFLNFSIDWAIYIQLIIIIIQFLIGPWFMDLMLRWTNKLSWININDLDKELAEFIIVLCDKENISVPKIGIIDDNAFNAFTYGRTPKSARLVFTNGILKHLNISEQKAVTAHEFGHIVHWDFVFMTLAQMIPTFFYIIYKKIGKLKSKSSSNDNSAAQAAIVAAVAYVFYIISEYLVLYLSRVREYYADRYSAKITNNPNDLSSALIKIAYGIALSDKTEDDKKDDHLGAKAFQSLGISDIDSSDTYGLLAANFDTSDDSALGAMQWDLWNPWAMYYEIQSTHPLTAKRITQMSEFAKSLGQEPRFVFNKEKPESYWDELLVDLGVKFLPTLAIILSGVIWFLSGANKSFSMDAISKSLVLIGTASIVKVLFSYNFSGFDHFSITSLLKKIKVSAIRGIPCKINGEIIGKGIPGYVFSEDLVLKDKSGFMYLDYNQPLAIFNFLFSIFRANKYIGQKVTIEGWYRRAPRPYIEVYKITREDGGTGRCYTYNAKLIFSSLILVTGIVLSAI